VPGKVTVTSIGHSADEAVYEVSGAKPAELLRALAESSVAAQTVFQIGDDVVFSASLADRLPTGEALDALGAVWSERGHLGKVVVAGSELCRGELAARALEVLRDLRLEPQFVAASSTQLSFYVPRDDVERAVEALNDAFGLGKRKKEPSRA
jgi:aspartokinase